MQSVLNGVYATSEHRLYDSTRSFVRSDGRPRSKGDLWRESTFWAAAMLLSPSKYVADGLGHREAYQQIGKNVDELAQQQKERFAALRHSDSPQK
jgi:hypothetical protein